MRPMEALSHEACFLDSVGSMPSAQHVGKPRFSVTRIFNLVSKMHPKRHGRKPGFTLREITGFVSGDYGFCTGSVHFAKKQVGWKNSGSIGKVSGSIGKVSGSIGKVSGFGLPTRFLPALMCVNHAKTAKTA